MFSTRMWQNGNQFALVLAGLSIIDFSKYCKRLKLLIIKEITSINKAKILTGTRTISFTDNVSHACFVGDEACQMDWLRWIVFWESLYLSAMALGSLLWVEGHRAMTRCREFTMRL